MRVCLIATTLAAAALSTPALAQRHADVVYLQQMKAKHAREVAENAKRMQEGEASAPAPAKKAKPSVPATARPTPPSTSN